MGRGNWRPGQCGDSYELVYVEVLDPKGTYTTEDVEDAYDELWLKIKGLLPKSYQWVGSSSSSPYRRWATDDRSLAYNGFFELAIDVQGDWWHQGLALVLREHAPRFAHHWLRREAVKLFDALAQEYELSVRRCAWTVGPYMPSSSEISSNTNEVSP